MSDSTKEKLKKIRRTAARVLQWGLGGLGLLLVLVLAVLAALPLLLFMQRTHFSRKAGDEPAH